MEKETHGNRQGVDGTEVDRRCELRVEFVCCLQNKNRCNQFEDNSVESLGYAQFDKDCEPELLPTRRTH